uniref:Replication initiator protein n=1 Tax=Dulem virus 150 TaxID=3145627 RepID=A0AAU8AYE4_9VIRU
MQCTSPKDAILTNQSIIQNGQVKHHRTFLKIVRLSEKPNLEKWTETFHIGKKVVEYVHEYVKVPCRKCPGCIINKANDWAVRSTIEASAWKKNCFLTLTYAPEHLPKNRNLAKRDMQLFWKKLRKHAKGEESWTWKDRQEKPIRFFYCGEYGPKTLRPHYHAGVFNYWPADAKPFKISKHGDQYYTSEFLNRTWGKGYVIIGRLDYESAAYIARYTMKKLQKLINEQKQAYFELLEEVSGSELEYLQNLLGEPILQPKNQIPEFIETSRRGGIGLAGWLKNKDKLQKNYGTYVKSRKGGQALLKKLPQFLRQKWMAEDREYYNTASEAQRLQIAELYKNKIENIHQISEINLEKFKKLKRNKI